MRTVHNTYNYLVDLRAKALSTDFFLSLEPQFELSQTCEGEEGWGGGLGRRAGKDARHELACPRDLSGVCMADPPLATPRYAL